MTDSSQNDTSSRFIHYADGYSQRSSQSEDPSLIPLDGVSATQRIDKAFALKSIAKLEDQRDHLEMHQAGVPVASAATVSLVFGLLSLCFTPPLISALVAIVAGYLARRDIGKASGQLGGARQAMAGMIMGGISLALTLLVSFVGLVWLILSRFSSGS